MESSSKMSSDYANPYKDYLLDSFVDFLDEDHSGLNWVVGKIVKVEDDTNIITVNIEGWSERFDIDVQKNDKRIAPFRRHSKG